jgi:hypothetical protein
VFHFPKCLLTSFFLFVIFFLIKPNRYHTKGQKLIFCRWFMSGKALVVARSQNKCPLSSTPSGFLFQQHITPPGVLPSSKNHIPHSSDQPITHVTRTYLCNFTFLNETS